jgi:hypothetical protein
MSKIYYSISCLIKNLAPEVHIPGIPNDLFRRLFPHLQILYSKLFSRAIFNCLYGVIKRTWLMLFLSLLVYLQALFFLNAYLKDCKLNVICYWTFNLNFESKTAVKEELFQVILVLLITVSELYFVNILRSKGIEDEDELAKTVSRLCIGFFKFRATSSNLSLQVDLKDRFLEKHSHVVQNSFAKFKKLLDNDPSAKIKQFAQIPNQLFLQLSSFQQ